MKYVCLIIILFASSRITVSAQDSEPAYCRNGSNMFVAELHNGNFSPYRFQPYIPVYENDFDTYRGDDMFRFAYPWGPHLNTSRPSLSDPSNVFIQDGKLIMKISIDPGERTIQTDNGSLRKFFKFTSSAMSSLFELNMASIEVRMRVNNMDATQSSVWVFDECSEIDFIEYFRDRKKAPSAYDAAITCNSNMGSDHEVYDEDCSGDNCWDVRTESDPFLDLTQWHVWRFDWELNFVSVYCDDVLVIRHTRWRDLQGRQVPYNEDLASATYQRALDFARFNDPMPLLLTFFVNSRYEDKEEANPYSRLITGNEYMEIDYLNIYKKARRCGDRYTVCSKSSLPSLYNDGHVFGKSVLLNGSCSETWNGFYSFFGDEYVDVLPGNDFIGTGNLSTYDCEAYQNKTFTTTVESYGSAEEKHDQEEQPDRFRLYRGSGGTVLIGSTSAEWPETDVLTLTGTDGKQWFRLHESTSSGLVDAGVLPAGTYIIRYCHKGECYSEKEVLIHD